MGLFSKLGLRSKGDKSARSTSPSIGPSASGLTRPPPISAKSSSIKVTTAEPPRQDESSAPPLLGTTPSLLGAPAEPPASDAAPLPTSDGEGLWARAYKLVQNREPDLMEDYATYLASLQGHGATVADFTTSKSVESIVTQLLENRKKKQWRIQPLGKEVIIREQVEKLAKFILFVEPVVIKALSSQPYAALAWSGDSILLPLITSASTVNEAMLKGFNLLGDIQILWKTYEDTYLQPPVGNIYGRLIEPLAKLYSYVIEYQGRVICHLSKPQASRAWKNITGWNDWDGKATEIGEMSEFCCGLISPLQAREIQQSRDSQLQEIQMSRTILEGILKMQKQSNEQAEKTREDEKERELLQDLTSNYEDDKNFNSERVPGTCEWFFRDDRFLNWRDSNTSSLLWVSAGPGCGKSVLSRTLVDERRLSTNIMTSTVCYFFFKDGDERRMSASHALCAILHQIFTRHPARDLIRHALPSHKNHGKSLSSNFSELWRILKDCAESPDAGEIICVLDALDECEKDSRKQLIDKVKDFYCQPNDIQNLPSKLKFLITSRPYDVIEASFRKFSDTAYVRFDGDEKFVEISEEINLVIDFKVDQIAADFGFSESDQRKISERLKSMKNRTYLWLHLTLDIIEQNPAEFGKRSEVEALLSDMPSEVSEAYEKILGRSKNQVQTEALLQIILAAERPLTLAEANTALTLALKKHPFNSHCNLKSDLWPEEAFKSTVKNLCGLFISVYDSTLSFIHLTAREFLIHPKKGEGKWEGRLGMLQSHAKLSLICLEYLSFLGDQSESKKILSRFGYSAQYWMQNARCAESDGEVRESIMSFFRQNQAYSTWRACYLSSVAIGDGYHDDATPLEFMCGEGLPYIAKLLLTEGADVNARYGSALRLASLRGHKEMVQLLLKEGADIHARDGHTLGVAIEYGHKEVVQLLLKEGANVNAGNGYALEAASRNGHKDIVQLLLKEGANVNANDGDALEVASVNGHKEIVQLLLKEGADVNTCDGRALEVASEYGHTEIVQLLLKEGADINAGNGRALLTASFNGHKEIVQLLLKEGADINAGDGRAPLGGTRRRRWSS
ncbi:uncharacterized protein GIQ15_01044 [Arthroderma uncinatum]|uniref:uncharacterized protein n=1 Tax=Arthroderma uncinatum TaxID=74035 RepID=UPI00144A6CA4|nr:uncharacterized protein GIQ15_01044 [Arthroderma uncinatum]KAF3491527.1 hypothetical protein GIQ15_01044 [Arthroderma uncinatum]